MDLGLKGKVALVTGAGSQIGFGKGIAMTLAEEGCDIIVNDVDHRPIAPLPGFVSGVVTDAFSDQELSDVKISTDASASALSLTDGNYIMVHPPGTFTVTAQVTGYNTKSYSGIRINEGDIKIRDIALVPGSTDTDNDGISDTVENASACLDADDADTDDDCIPDG